MDIRLCIPHKPALLLLAALTSMLVTALRDIRIDQIVALRYE